MTSRQMLDKSDISQTIVLAYHFYTVFGQALLQDEEVRTLLFRLDQNIEATKKEMVAIGVVNDCADCAVNGDGTCCGKRTGYKYDNILLLINLLLGESLPTKPQDLHLCYFLTKEGCVLRARHVICVNYLCKRLRKNIQHSKLVRLQEIAGEELNTLFILEEYIKRVLQGNVRRIPL
jgi:hypothetical protein